jgi:hypothetical protein
MFNKIERITEQTTRSNHNLPPNEEIEENTVKIKSKYIIIDPDWY